MGRTDYFALGQWDFYCDICGFKTKSSEARTTWDGYKTCGRCWYPRNPQDFVKGKIDNQTTPWTRPAPPTFSTAGYNVSRSINGASGNYNSMN